MDVGVVEGEAVVGYRPIVCRCDQIRVRNALESFEVRDVGTYVFFYG